MDDREMLEWAAKAAGVNGELTRTIGGWACILMSNNHPWQPRHDDGDCARLEATLSIDITWFDNHVEATCYTEQANFKVIDAAAQYEDFPDKQSARRHASVQVAAAIGKEGK